LGGAQYLPYGAIALAIMVWSIPFGWINSVTNYVLIALGQQRDLTRAFAVALLFNILANLWLVPVYGYQAAAVVTIISEIAEGLWFYYYLRRGLGPLPWLAWLWPLWLSAVAMTAIVWALWSVSPLLALLLGAAAYAGGVLGLRAFDAEERGILRGILPERLPGR
jgi:O-antigen/teichoic acid export membrane protein